MNDKSQGSDRTGWSRAKAISAVALLVVAGVVMFLYWADDGDVTEQLIAGVGDNAYAMTCSSCEAAFTMPAKEYVTMLAGRAKGSAEGIPCIECGAPKAWRASEIVFEETPGESDEEYNRRNAGRVGRAQLRKDAPQVTRGD